MSNTQYLTWDAWPHALDKPPGEDEARSYTIRVVREIPRRHQLPHSIMLVKRISSLAITQAPHTLEWAILDMQRDILAAAQERDA